MTNLQRFFRLIVVGLVFAWVLAITPQVPLLGSLLLVSEAIRSFPVLMFSSWILGFAISIFLWSKSAARASLLIFVVLASSTFYVSRIWPFFTAQTELVALNGETVPLSIAIVNAEFGRASAGSLRVVLPQKLPDVLVVSEVTKDWLVGADLHFDYQYKVEAPGKSAEGIAVFSRFPLEAVQKVTPEFFATLAMNLRVSDSTLVYLVALHAPPPHADPGFNFRKGYFDAVGQHLLTIPITVPLLLAGDFNTTPLSDAYQTFVTRHNLRNIAHGRGLPPTWPSRTIPWMGAYIDQVLYRGLVEGIDLQLLKSFGSDHFPLHCNFRVTLN